MSIIKKLLEKQAEADARKDEFRNSQAERKLAKPQAQVECPHCHVAGGVTTKRVKVKQGISGGKATGAIITGGISILATGLSRKQTVTQARCANCKVTWHIQ